MKDKLFATLLLLSFAVAPLTYASNSPVGAPRNVCDQDAIDSSHEYGPSTGFVIFLGQDGNLNDCDGDFDPANPETETADYDAHVEFAFGGAWLTARASPGCNDGDWVDHPQFPTVTVTDYVLSQIPADVGFSVYADTLNNIPPVDPNEPNCGDFESDYGADCVNSCTVGFPAGLDGTYQVYVNGVTGKITTGGNLQPAHPRGDITIHDFGSGPVVLAQPPGWTCSPLSVTGSTATGATWTLTCSPPTGVNACRQVDALGYGITNGSLSVTSSCVGLGTTAATPLPGSASSSAFGAGAFPWTCKVEVTASPPTDVWAHCSVN